LDLTSVLAPLAQYGILGIAAALLVLFARTLLKREQERGDAAALEVTRLNTLMQEKIIPALITATLAIVASQSILQAIQYQRDIESAAAKVK
jgi:hypothetical protein